MFLRACLSATLLALLAAACGGTSGSDDPRCAALCTIKQPSTPNVGDVCSQASADSCLEQCGAQVKDTTAACGDCLLVDADFGTGDETSGGGCGPTVACPGGECMESGPGGTCTYCSDDMTAEQNCYAMAHPRREVECKVDFRDPLKCATLCTAAK